MTIHSNRELVTDGLRLDRHYPITNVTEYLSHLVNSHGYSRADLPTRDDFSSDENLMFALDAFHMNARRSPAPRLTPPAEPAPRQPTLAEAVARLRATPAYAYLRVLNALVFPLVIIALQLKAARNPARRPEALTYAAYNISTTVGVILELRQHARSTRA